MAERSQNLHTSRLEAKLASVTARTRASTIQEPVVTSTIDPLKLPDRPVDEDEHTAGDVFASQQAEPDRSPELAVPDTFEELPIEIRSLTERFLESLSAKVHPSPLSADALSDLFQDFYTRASAKINTHIATLSARLNSDSYKKTPTSSRPGSIRSGSGDGPEQQMLSASEMSDRKKARRLLEVKRIALEEAVERAVCEKVYDRIWRHRSTDDEERDHKLRSRTAALSLVGIGLKELLMTAEDLSEEERQKGKEREEEIREWLSSARNDISRMNDEKYPFGKLHHLTAAHKSIVEALSKIFPATSSADEILPTLIYTLITMPPSGVNVVGDLKFIQRFRGSSRMDGETAYCLVNLEAAISFLETVDLSSLRADDDKPSSRPSTPRSEITPMALGLSDAPDLTQAPTSDANSARVTNQPPSPDTKANRRLSNLIQAQTNRIEAASDAVRDSILDSTDQALGRINNTLESSFKFFFGKNKSQHPSSPVHDQPVLPKTLEDARKLVNSPTRLEYLEDANGAGSMLNEHHHSDKGPDSLGAKMSDLFGGKKPSRDHSVDSTQSGGSSQQRPPLATESHDVKPALVSAKTEPAASSNTSAVDSIRNMGSSLNPLNRFASINVLPRFGRTVSGASPTPPISTPTSEPSKPLPPPINTNRNVSGEIVQVDDKGFKAIAALEVLKKTAPPAKKFLDAKDAQDLKLKEVEELLRDYQRLATALRGAINY